MATLVGKEKITRRRAVSGNVPLAFAAHYTQGQAAVMAVIFRVVKRSGTCDLTLERIADLAGVGVSTVQTTLRRAQAHSHVEVDRAHDKGKVHVSMDLNWIEVLEQQALLSLDADDA